MKMLPCERKPYWGNLGAAARESAKYERPPMGNIISSCAARSMILALKPSLTTAVVGKE